MRALALFVMVILGCATNPVRAQPTAAMAAPPGATTCSGCHLPARAAASTAIPPLHGRDAAEIVVAMRAYRSGERSATVMNRLARGFSEDETAAIAAWLGAQR